MRVIFGRKIYYDSNLNCLLTNATMFQIQKPTLAPFFFFRFYFYSVQMGVIITASGCAYFQRLFDHFPTFTQAIELKMFSAHAAQ